ncbi:hypothetical protein ES703_22189 [subsurface metagenome]
MNGIVFLCLDGEPFLELVNSRPVKRHLHNCLMARRVEEDFPSPVFVRTDTDFENVAILNGPKDDIFSPGSDGQAFGFPEAVHYCGSGEVAVAVPALDDSVGLLDVPHDTRLAIEPFGGGWYRLAVVEIDAAFDGIGVAVGTTSFPFVVAIVDLEVAECFSCGPAVGPGFVDQIHGVEAV